MAEQVDNVISQMKIHPKYLQSNATSHTWAFAAFAELIDNAFDAKAKEIQIDELSLHNTRCLSFQDDGRGMDAGRLHHMLSFGYSEAHERHHVGMYGSGFKSGSMRLGKDVIVFTRTADSAGVGLLSQTYLKAISADSVLVPMLHYTFPGLHLVEQRGRYANLTAILEHSPFREEEEIIHKLAAFPGTGTLIIIYNLCKVDKFDRIELDFTRNPDDIRCPDNTGLGEEEIDSYRSSLRQYCSILYLHPKMKVKIRGRYVKTRLIDKCLRHIHMDEYQPKGENKVFKITFGQVPVTDKSEDYGIMFYRDNRLIKPYEKVTCQRQNDGVGLGIVGVTDAGFLTPTQNKQDFVRDKKFLAAMTSYSIKLKNYWTRMCDTVAVPSCSEETDWVQCDICLKWRRLPSGYDTRTLPEKWYCRLHPHNIDCNFPEDVHSAGEQVKRARKKRRESDPTRSDCNFPEDVHSAGEQVKRARKKRRESDATRRLQPKTKCEEVGAEENVKECKQTKMSMFLQSQTPRSGYNKVRPVVGSPSTPICNQSASLSPGHTWQLSHSSSVRETSSAVTDGQSAVGSGDSVEILSSQPGGALATVDQFCNLSVTGDDSSAHDNSARGDYSRTHGNSTRGDYSRAHDNSVRGDYSRARNNSTRGDYSRARNNYTRGDYSKAHDNSVRGDYSNVHDNYARGDYSNGCHVSTKGYKSIDGGNSTSNKPDIQQTDQPGSLATKQEGDCADYRQKYFKQFPENKFISVDNSSEKSITSEPVGDNAPVHINSEPVGESAPVHIKSEPVGNSAPVHIKPVGNNAPVHIKSVGDSAPVHIKSVGDSAPVHIKSVGDSAPVHINSKPVGESAPVHITSEPVGNSAPVHIKSEPVGDSAPVHINSKPVGESAPVHITSEPVGNNAPVHIKSEPVSDNAPVHIKSVGDSAPVQINSALKVSADDDDVTAALMQDESQGLKMVDQELASIKAKVQVETDAKDKEIADMQRKLNSRDKEINRIQNQLQKFSNSVRELLRRLKPGVVITESANIQQLVESMLVANMDD